MTESSDRKIKALEQALQAAVARNCFKYTRQYANFVSFVGGLMEMIGTLKEEIERLKHQLTEATNEQEPSDD